MVCLCANRMFHFMSDTGLTIYRCTVCGRLLVIWSDQQTRTWYLPEPEVAETMEKLKRQIVELAAWIERLKTGG